MAYCLRGDIIHHPTLGSCSLSGGCQSRACCLLELFEKESEPWTAVSSVNEISTDVPEILLGDIWLQILPEKQF